MRLLSHAMYGSSESNQYNQRGLPHLQDIWFATIYSGNPYLPAELQQPMTPQGVQAFRMLNALRLFKLAVSLGGTESLVSHPSSTTHSDYSAEAKARCGIGDNLVRLSVGIVNVVDLYAPLVQPLAGI